MEDVSLRKKNRDLTILVSWIIAVSAVLILFYYSLNKFFDHDELFAIHTAWKILRGEKMYTGFMQLHHPLLHLLLTPVITIFGENINSLSASRVFIFITFLLILAVTYRLSSRVFGKETGIISLALLTTTLHFVNRGIEVRPDVPQTLFNLLSILYLLDFLETRSKKSLILGSVFLGVAFLFLQKAIILIFLVECLFLYGAYRRLIGLKEFLLHVSVIALVVAPFYLYIFLSGSFAQYILFSWIIHTKLLENSSPLSLLTSSLRLNPALWGFYALAILFFIKIRTQKMFIFVSLGLLATVFVARAPNPQYLLPSFPLMACAAAYAIYSLFRKKKLILALAIIISTVKPLYMLAKYAKNTNSGQLHKIEYVLKNSGPEDYVYDGNTNFNVFRKDLDYIWFIGKPSTGVLATYQSMTDYKYDVPQLIEKFRPRIISVSFRQYLIDPTISRYYVPSDEFRDLYIRDSTKE